MIHRIGLILMTEHAPILFRSRYISKAAVRSARVDHDPCLLLATLCLAGVNKRRLSNSVASTKVAIRRDQPMTLGRCLTVDVFIGALPASAHQCPMLTASSYASWSTIETARLSSHILTPFTYKVYIHSRNSQSGQMSRTTTRGAISHV